MTAPPALNPAAQRITPRSVRTGLALFLLMAAVFVMLNRSAYKGYFLDDDFENLSWSPKLDVETYVKEFISPKFHIRHFRPLAQSYYYAMDKLFGMDFPKYIAVIHALHLLNGVLLWLVIRKLGIGRVAASIGVFFFVFHGALLDAYWKPSYVYDVLCAAFCLASLLLYMHERLVLSIVAFWCAYKSKELAVMFPVALACYEFLLASRRWKRLLPFFIISISFAVQALINNWHTDTNYTFHFTLEALRATLPFYSSAMFFGSYAGLALLALPFLVRDRRVWFGIAWAGVYLAPLIVLPGRLVAAYWYVPSTGLAIALAAIAALRYRTGVAIFLALWIPLNLIEWRRMRRAAIILEYNHRTYADTLRTFVRSAPGMRYFVWDIIPSWFSEWGVIALLNCLYGRLDSELIYIDDPRSRPLLDSGAAAMLSSNPPEDRLRILRTAPGVTYLALNTEKQAYQLGEGWYALDHNFRWIHPDAEAILWRPAGAREFELSANVTAAQLAQHRKIELQVQLNGQVMGEHEFVREGWATYRWKLPPGPPGATKISFHATPGFQPPGDARVLGVGIQAFGFR